MRLAALALAACAHASAAPAHLAPRSAAQDGRSPPAPAGRAAFAVSVSGAGRPVILIPGLGCPGSVWDDTVRHLHAQAHVVTLAGFAGTPAIAEPVFAAARAQLAAYARTLDHPVIIGHSLGGMLALAIAADAPTGPVIVVDSAANLGFAPAAARQMRDDVMRDFDRNVRDFFAGMAVHEDRLAPVIDAVLRSDHRAFGEAMLDVFTADVRPDLKRIHVPVLVVLAADTPRSLIEAQLGKLATIVVVPNTKHFVMLDDPDAFFTAIDRFLLR